MLDQPQTRTFRERFREMVVPFSWRRITVALLSIFVAAGCVLGGLVAHAAWYRDRVLPGVTVGNIPVGGMDKNALRELILAMNDKLVDAGLPFTLATNGKEHSFLLYPVIVTEESTVELMSMNIDAEVERLLAYGKEGDILTRAYRAAKSRARHPELALATVTVDRNRLFEELGDEMEPFESQPQNAAMVIQSIDPLRVAYTSSTAGIVVPLDTVPAELSAAWSRLEVPAVRLSAVFREPEITQEDLVPFEARLPALFAGGPLTLTYTNPYTKQTENWTLTNAAVAEWLDGEKKDGSVSLVLNKERVLSHLHETIVPEIAVPAVDARFRVDEAGNVVEFQGSRPGVTVDAEKLYEEINRAVIGRMLHGGTPASTLAVAVTQTEPDLTTAEVNTLGISEVLGVGVSAFGGSPGNRIVNIRNGVKKLNGLLIKPGDVFSTVAHTGPFTAAGGYVPELVIKGNEIKPEIGGGLCQISTTLFRMAMNSGLEIVERSNHGLVVRYYNDPTNGLPGTDATIYDPSPDFKFRNDTGHHVLIQTDIDEQKGELVFTLWGKSDGRKGSYTPPSVHRWIPYGETRNVETTTLPPGQKKCQNAYRGAEASFTYTRYLPDGRKEDKIFSSYYRALPQVCLVGVAVEPAAAPADTPAPPTETAGEGYDVPIPPPGTVAE